MFPLPTKTKFPAGQRMSLEQCRKIAPELNNLTDGELLEARDLLYELGQVVFDLWRYENSGSNSPIWDLTENKEEINVEI